MAHFLLAGCHTLAAHCAPTTSSSSSQVYVYGDCAINVNPNADELSEIAIASAGTARAFGIDPRVAMLSYATGDSNSGPMIDKVIQATERARSIAPDAGLSPELIEGPIQFDAAVDPAVAAVKFRDNDSLVAGRATVCIFPDLNVSAWRRPGLNARMLPPASDAPRSSPTAPSPSLAHYVQAGNNAYKAVQQASKSSAVGPIMQGLRMPVNDLSRGCTVEDVVNTVVCTALQSIAVKQENARKAEAATAAQ